MWDTNFTSNFEEGKKRQSNKLWKHENKICFFSPNLKSFKLHFLKINLKLLRIVLSSSHSVRLLKWYSIKKLKLDRILGHWKFSLSFFFVISGIVKTWFIRRYRYRSPAPPILVIFPVRKREISGALLKTGVKIYKLKWKGFFSFCTGIKKIDGWHV